MKGLLTSATVLTLLVAAQQGYAQISDEDLVIDAGVLGKIRGTTGLTAEDGGIRREYIQFRGIPYGSVPERFLVSTSGFLRSKYNQCNEILKKKSFF